MPSHFGTNDFKPPVDTKLLQGFGSLQNQGILGGWNSLSFFKMINIFDSLVKLLRSSVQIFPHKEKHFVLPVEFVEAVFDQIRDCVRICHAAMLGEKFLEILHESQSFRWAKMAEIQEEPPSCKGLFQRRVRVQLGV